MAKVRILFDGKDSFTSILNEINNAQKTIFIKVFIWRDDLIGNKIARALLKAADRKVKITIFKEKLGAIHERTEETRQSFLHKEAIPEFSIKIIALTKMYAAKSKYFPAKQRTSLLANALKNHKKIVIKKDQVKYDHSKYFVFDDKILILGGVNIEDKEIYCDIMNKKYNDYMVWINDAAIVKRFRTRMLNEVKFNPQKKIDFIFNYKDRFEVKPIFLDLLDKAKQSIVIENSYWNEKDFIKKIVELIEKGIKITLILPREANLQNDLNLQTISKIYKKTKQKVQIFLCNNMMHAKMILIDDRYVIIGSSNLNKLSMGKMNEMNVYLDSNKFDFLPLLLENIEKHKKNSLEITNQSDFHYNSFRAVLENIFT